MEEIVCWCGPLAAVLIAGFAIFAYFFWGKDEPFRPIFDENLPDQLSALEIGFLMDGVYSGEDLGVALFDWAAKGFVTLQMAQEGWVITAGQADASSMRDYEYKAWEFLFREKRQVSAGKDNRLIAQASRILQDGVEEKLSGPEYALNSPLASRMSLVVWLLGLSEIVFVGFFAMRWAHIRLYLGIPVVLGMAACAISMTWFGNWYQRYYLLRSRRKNAWIKGLMAAAFAVLAGVECLFPWALTRQLLPCFWMTLSGAVTVTVAPFVSKRSAYAQDMLNRVVGFRQALADPKVFPCRKTGETDDDYYLRLLPFAQVMGVGQPFMQQLGNRVLKLPQWLIWRSEEETATAMDIQASLANVRRELLRLEEIPRGEE